MHAKCILRAYLPFLSFPGVYIVKREVGMDTGKREEGLKKVGRGFLCKTPVCVYVRKGVED